MYVFRKILIDVKRDSRDMKKFRYSQRKAAYLLL